MLSRKLSEVLRVETPPIVKIREVLSELTSLIDDAVIEEGNLTGGLQARSDHREDVNDQSSVNPGLVETFIDTRRARNAFFPKNWFSDPSWDILLFLFLAHLKGEAVTVGSLSNGTESRPTTTIRWIDIMESYQLVSRSRCSRDSRRVYVNLAPKGVDAMDAFFASIAKTATQF